MLEAQAKFPESSTKRTDCDAKKQEVNNTKLAQQSLDNRTRMAKENTKARCSHQPTEPRDPVAREFSSYFLGDADTSEPTYLVTSHASDRPTQSPVTHIYPIQTLRWNPYVETNAVVQCGSQVQCEVRKETQNVTARKFTCKCKNCVNLSCPSRTMLCQPGFKNNIMTFCDKCTMTPQLSSAGCGSHTPISCTPVMSHASVTRSDIAVRDTMDRTPYCCHSPQRFRTCLSRHNIDSICVPPILKKPLLQSSFQRYDYTTRTPVLIDMEAERDIPDACYPETPCWRDKECEQSYANRPGRTLYNEGICKRGDNELFSPRRRRSASVKRDKSGVSFSSFFSKYDDKGETFIPHSHNHDSKYHSSCMEQPCQLHRDDNDGERRGLVASPKITRRSFLSVQNYRPTSYVLPKRVLTSNPDHNIEKFLQHNCCTLQRTKKKQFFK